MADREFQLVVFGATGFTGSLAVRYITKQYGNSIRWAIAGRNEAKLQKLAKQWEAPCSVIVADSDDDKALRSMAKRTAAVATCAGPFARYGSKLVAACVAEGTGYCDITGEVAWVREMIAEHHDEAAKTGARIVNLCGHDSIPWDLTTLMLAKKLKEKGEDLVSINMYDSIKGTMSGGTLETAMGIMFGKEKNRGKTEAVRALGFDPLLKLKGQSQSSSNTSVRNVDIMEFDTQKPRVKFFMAGVNANAVKRSNAFNNYGPRISYREGQACSNVFAAMWAVLSFMCFGVSMMFPPTRWFMRKFVLPAPGEGPSEKAMEEGYLTVEGRAKGSKDSTVNAKMHFSVDAGYKDTARMVVEAALALSLEGDKIKVPGGVYTPAACQGEVLLERLLKTGTAFEYCD